MFRLIQLHTENDVPRIGVDPDGYVSARTALARYRSAPAAYFGVGRFDHEGTLAEIILDRLCGPLGDCPRPASVVHARTYQRLCETCAYGLDVLTIPQLAMLLGIACRLAPVLARSGRHAALEEASPSGNRIAREFPGRVTDAILGDPSADLEDVGGVGGTLAGNALSLAATRAALSEVLTADAFEHSTAVATRLREGI